MLLTKTFTSALLATALAGLSTLTSAVPSSAQVLSGLSDYHQSVLSAQRTIDNYNGGIMNTLSSAREMYNLEKAGNNARTTFAAAEPIAANDMPQYEEQFRALHGSLVDTLRVVSSKADTFDKAGVKPFANMLLKNFAENNDLFEQAAKDKVPKDNQTALTESFGRLAGEFKNTLDSYA